MRCEMWADQTSAISRSWDGLKVACTLMCPFVDEEHARNVSNIPRLVYKLSKREKLFVINIGNITTRPHV